MLGHIGQGAVQIVQRGDRFFIRYYTGAHQVIWREDEIPEQDVIAIQTDEANIEPILFGIQSRLLKSGIKPYISNWSPE